MCRASTVGGEIWRQLMLKLIMVSSRIFVAEVPHCYSQTQLSNELPIYLCIRSLKICTFLLFLVHDAKDNNYSSKAAKVSLM